MAPNLPVDPKDLIEMPIRRILCPLHGEVFRSKWPKGMVIFALEGLSKLFADSEIAIRCAGDPAKVAEMLDAQPICCALTQDDLMQCYLKADIGVRGKCVRCKKINIGAPFKTTNAAGIKDHKHMCFWCVVHNLRKQKG